jgi:hypothetical protein
METAAREAAVDGEAAAPLAGWEAAATSEVGLATSTVLASMRSVTSQREVCSLLLIIGFLLRFVHTCQVLET